MVQPPPAAEAPAAVSAPTEAPTAVLAPTQAPSADQPPAEAPAEVRAPAEAPAAVSAPVETQAKVPAPVPAPDGQPAARPLPLPAVTTLPSSSSENPGVPPRSMGGIMLAKMECSADNKQTFTQPMQSPASAKWVETCATEVATLLDNEVHAHLRSSFRAVPFRSGQGVHEKGKVLCQD